MKKSIIALSLIAFAGLMLLNGCGATNSTAATSITPSAAATSIGLLCKDGLSIDNSVLGIFSYSGVKSSGVKACAPASIIYGSDDWWSAINTYEVTEGGSTYSYNYAYKFRAWDTNGEITTNAALKNLTESTVSKLWMAVTYTYAVGGTSALYKFGTDINNPMKMVYGTSRSIDGTISYASTYGTESYETIITYNALTMNTSGYPTGSVNWELKTNGNSAYTGSITYDGTNIAICTFSSGGSGRYSVNLDTGLATAL